MKKIIFSQFPLQQVGVNLVNYVVDLIRWLNLLLTDIVNTVNKHEEGGVDYLQLTPQSSAPVSPRDGYIVYADGVNWNPGSGKGLYEYRNGAWYKL